MHRLRTFHSADEQCLHRLRACCMLPSVFGPGPGQPPNLACASANSMTEKFRNSYLSRVSGNLIAGAAWASAVNTLSEYCPTQQVACHGFQSKILSKGRRRKKMCLHKGLGTRVQNHQLLHCVFCIFEDLSCHMRSTEAIGAHHEVCQFSRSCSRSPENA